MRKMERLTRDDLRALGVISVNWIEEEHRYEVIRLWKRAHEGKGKYAKTRLTKLRPCKTVSRRKYAPDGVGMNVCLHAGRKQNTYALGKFVYAWFVGEVPEGYGVVSCKRGEPDEYKLENLSLKSKADLESNKSAGNQYFSKKWGVNIKDQSGLEE